MNRDPLKKLLYKKEKRKSSLKKTQNQALVDTFENQAFDAEWEEDEQLSEQTKMQQYLQNLNEAQTKQLASTKTATEHSSNFSDFPFPTGSAAGRHEHNNSNLLWKDKTVVITGGNSGIGNDIARLFQSHGADIASIFLI